MNITVIFRPIPKMQGGIQKMIRYLDRFLS